MRSAEAHSTQDLGMVPHVLGLLPKGLVQQPTPEQPDHIFEKASPSLKITAIAVQNRQRACSLTWQTIVFEVLEPKKASELAHEMRIM